MSCFSVSYFKATPCLIAKICHTTAMATPHIPGQGSQTPNRGFKSGKFVTSHFNPFQGSDKPKIQEVQKYNLD